MTRNPYVCMGNCSYSQDIEKRHNMEDSRLVGLSSGFVQEVSVRVQSLARFSESHGISLDPGLTVQAKLLTAHVTAKERILAQTRISTISNSSESRHSLTTSGEILITEAENHIPSSSSSHSQHSLSPSLKQGDAQQRLAMARMRAEAAGREKTRLEEAQLEYMRNRADFSPSHAPIVRNRRSEVKLEAPLFSTCASKSRRQSTEEDHTELLAQMIGTRHKVQALQQRLQLHECLRAQEAALQAELTLKLQSLTSLVSQLHQSYPSAVLFP